jgi:hypothetical protein
VIPSFVTFTIDREVLCFPDTTGVVFTATVDPNDEREWSGTSGDLQQTTAQALTVRCNTTEFVNGRRLKGRMFIGPLSSDGIAADAQVNSTLVSVTPDRLDGLISGLGGRMCVWHRPTVAAPSSGSYGDITSFVANTVPGTLRSRKR